MAGLDFHEELQTQLEQIKEVGNYREVRYLKPLSATRIRYGERTFLNLCSNSYLSLHVHPDVLTAAKDAIDEYGAGTCSSRSVSGSIELYRQLADQIAAFKSYPGALIFSNGYMANMGIIATLTDQDDIIFSDELNHSSIIDSTRLSRAKKVIYRHLDTEDLEKKLRRQRTKGRKFIVTETVFSMDGDLAPLDRIHMLKEKYGAQLLIDEAHATGVFGEKGQGVEELFGIGGRMDVQMGTFGKSFGSFGAFALSHRTVLDFLINRARTFMYTTALPAASLAASLAALRLVREDRRIKDELWANIGYMRSRLTRAGFDLKESQGPIVPIVVGEDKTALLMQQMLLDKGVFLQAIRPPTVPEGTSRLRLTIVRAFTRTDMDQALEALIETGREVGLI